MFQNMVRAPKEFEMALREMALQEMEDKEQVIIDQKGYSPVQCDKPLPCPFCGTYPELCQLMHRDSWQRVGRGRKLEKVRVCIISSSQILTGDTFWFKCPTCRCTTGGHHDTAQKAAETWNNRSAACLDSK